MQALNFTRRLLLAAAALLAFAAQAQAPASARIPVEAFFDRAAFQNARLSPNGRELAIASTRKGGRTQLVVVDTEKMTARVVAAPADVDIENIWWVNDQRLMFNVADYQSAVGDTYEGPGLYAVQSDGSDFRQLVERSQRTTAPGSRVMSWRTSPFATTRERKSDDVFVIETVRNALNEADSTNIFRLDTRTGRSTSFQRPGKALGWLLDAKDVPRVAVTREGDQSALHWLEPDGKWRKLAEAGLVEDRLPDPVAIGPDGTLYVAARPAGRDTRALYRYDVANAKVDGEPIIALPDYDFMGSFVMDGQQVRGIRYATDARATAWLDPGMKEVQSKIDALLVGTVNEIEFPLRAEVPIALVHAFSDVDPGRFLLYNMETGKLTLVGNARRDIDPTQMARRELVRYKAADGLTIPAWLTLPKGGKGRKHPMVVFPHGGPWVRGTDWQWSSYSQFLASRGYAVLEPEFRGSLGWGFQHFRKSWKQWGLAMQDDITDGVRWAVAQGITDADRVCIGGASYGGYAAMMGVAKDPDLYRCGFAWAGVTDIEMLFTVVWSDASSVALTYGMPLMAGDPKKDAEQLRATSPLHQAAKIKVPLLLGYGSGDIRVPIVHGTRFRDAVRKTNSAVEWVEYPNEGHGMWVAANRFDFWTRVEKFLERNIGAK